MAGRPQTIAEKILARASRQQGVVPDQVVEVAPDFSYAHDYAIFSLDAFKKMGASKVLNPDRIAICYDHIIPADSARDANNLATVREFAREQHFAAFYEGGTGISHQVMAEKGWVVPGSLVVSNDSHTPSGGSLGALAVGLGETDIGFLWATGKLWLKIPRTIRVVLDGQLRAGVYAKDLMLYMIHKLGVLGGLYSVLEFHGPAVKNFSISERFTMCNMTPELGAKSGVFPYDDVIEEFVRKRARFPFTPVLPDENAEYEREVQIDLSQIGPTVALPGREDRGVPITEVEGTKIQQVFIGSCTNAREDDLAIAANILRGKKVHPDVRLLVVPASKAVSVEVTRRGDMLVFLEAGATILPSGCAVCAGAHQGVLADGERCLSTSSRNTPGRMGNRNAEIFICSPAIAAASAITGVITDPKTLS